MEKKNQLDELPIAELSANQLEHLRQAEEQLNRDGKDVYLIAFEKGDPS